VIETRDLTKRCGSCTFFVPRATDLSGARSGECRLGCWPAPLKDVSTCGDYQQLGTRPQAKTTRATKAPRATTLVHAGVATASPLRAPLPSEIGIDMDQDEFRSVLREILLDELGVRDTELGDRWQNGELVLIPGKAGTAEKRIPIDSLFRKVVLIREKLRVLEQKINNHEKLDDNDRLQLQQYLTQCYGSLTTFNVLFKHKEDAFAGSGGKDD
jgi:hypothetical protein